MAACRARTGMAAAALAACVGGPALAQAQGVQSQGVQAMSPALTAAIGEWGVCRGRVVAELIPGADSADAIADEAMKRCEPEQARSRAEAVKALGRGGVVLIERAALTARAEVVERVGEQRSGAASTDPSAVWGDCLASQARKGAAGKAEAAAIVDQAYAACGDQEQQTRASLEGQVGREQTAALMGQLRALFHDQGPKLIARLRQGR